MKIVSENGSVEDRNFLGSRDQEVQGQIDSDGEGSDEKTPLTLTIPGPESNGEEGYLPTPQTPAERVRFLISSDDAVSTISDDLQLGRALFCQMDVLCHFDTGDSAWKESSRLVSLALFYLVSRCVLMTKNNPYFS